MLQVFAHHAHEPSIALSCRFMMPPYRGRELFAVTGEAVMVVGRPGDPGRAGGAG